MNKKIATVILTVFLVFNGFPAFAEKSAGTAFDVHNQITLQSEYDEVYVGERIKVTADISSVDSKAVKPVWKVNDREVPGYGAKTATPKDNSKLEFNYVVTPDNEASLLKVSLFLYDWADKLISSAEKSLIVKNEIPVLIQNTTKFQKAYTSEKVRVSVQVDNNTGRIFEYKAHWELNGKRIKGFSNDHFAVGETSGSSCPVILSGTAGEQEKVTFVLDNGLYSTSEDINIEVEECPPEVTYQKKVQEMRKTIKTVEIGCSLVRDSNIYTDIGLTKKTAFKKKGAKGIYVSYSGTTAAKVCFSDGIIGWVPYRNVYISEKNYTDTKGCSDELKEIFVNENGYKSNSKYLIWISLKFQQVNAFMGEKGSWKLVRSGPCASGKNITPTISGVFKYFEYESRWNFGQYYVGPVMLFNGGAALHSRTYKPDGSLLDPTLGRPASHGCVRLKQEDIDWLAHYIPLGTTVVVY
jgi:hypothetical protein